MTDTTQPSDDVELMEERMRRALGLGGPGATRTLTMTAAPRPQAVSTALVPRRAVRGADSMDGGSMAASTALPLQQRVVELERRLDAERQQCAQARQLLQQTELAVRSLETRSQHEALARQEELDGMRQATVRAQKALDDALFERQQRTAAGTSAKAKAREQASTASTSQAALITAEGRVDAIRPTSPAANTASPSKKRGRPRTRPLPEPKPVRWWTPSFRSKHGSK